MWVLENEGEAFYGNRLWLRPGKRYLFGRTGEAGQLKINGKKADTISRKHVMIHVDKVNDGDGTNLSSRSRVTVEDLKSKLGTTVNGHKIKGEKYVIEHDNNELQMGSFPAKFRITWVPVVLSYSFNAKELRADPLTRIRVDLEQLDIKFLSEYDVRTTHVVTKARNTSKGLQALINGKYVVDDRFVSAIIEAAQVQQSEGTVETSALEGDFDGSWPNPLEFVPTPGKDPVVRPAEDFVPNTERAEIFDGYTFIFYERTQFNSFLPIITSGKGKALFKEVTPGETQIDYFIRFVKEVSGEKGLGEFEDGSEGKGVVVVRFIPKESKQPGDADDQAFRWFSEFYTSVSLRLDHRLIDQKDFLDAILGNDASVLRRPLEPDTQQSTRSGPTSSDARPIQVDTQEQATHSQPIIPSRRRVRGAARSRFKGFVADDSDEEMADSPPLEPSLPAAVESSQEGLFVSQDQTSQQLDEVIQAARQSQRKRPAPPIAEARDVLEDFAPTAAKIKRRRIEAGEDPIPQRETQKETPPTPEPQPTEKFKRQTKTTKAAKAKKGSDILDAARQNKEEEEERLKAEREELRNLPDDLDLEEIRRLNIEEAMELRQDAPPPRTRERDVADGRWNPAWNGRKNFKKFRQRGAATAARPPQRIIVPLEEAKEKAYGMGDDYWLEDEGSRRKKEKEKRSQTSQSQGRSGTRETVAESQTQRGRKAVPTVVDSSDSETAAKSNQEDEDEEEDDIVMGSSRSRATRTSAQTSQRSHRTAESTQKTQSSISSKRPAVAPPAKEKPAKRTKVISIAASDDDESEDELRFRFRRR